MKNKFLTLLMCFTMCAPAVGCKDVSEYNPPDAPPSQVTTPEQPEHPEIPEQPDAPAPSDPVPPAPDVSEETPGVPDVPTVSPPVTVKSDILIASTVDSLNIRAGAGTSYKSIGTLDKSDMAMPVRKVGKWYEIMYKNSVGYVSESYIKTVSFTLANDKIEKVITEGKKLLGLPYVLGAQRYHWGNGKLNTNYDGKSYDCSSLMQYIFKIGANVNLAVTSREQSVQGTAVAKKDLKRGDLMFFTNSVRVNKTGVERIGHVAMYLGDNIILHTASDHAVIEPISSTRWGYYICARRVV